MSESFLVFTMLGLSVVLLLTLVSLATVMFAMTPELFFSVWFKPRVVVAVSNEPLVVELVVSDKLPIA